MTCLGGCTGRPGVYRWDRPLLLRVQHRQVHGTQDRLHQQIRERHQHKVQGREIRIFPGGGGKVKKNRLYSLHISESYLIFNNDHAF